MPSSPKPKHPDAIGCAYILQCLTEDLDGNTLGPILRPSEYRAKRQIEWDGGNYEVVVVYKGLATSKSQA